MLRRYNTSNFKAMYLLSYSSVICNLHVLLITLERWAIRPGEVARCTAGIVVHFRRGVKDVRSRNQTTRQPYTQRYADGRRFTHPRP